MKYFIAAPFGNYIKFKNRANIIPVTGTWTLKYRSGFVGRLIRILKTMRYDRNQNGWKNKLGLPNEGIKVGLKKNVWGTNIEIIKNMQENLRNIKGTLKES